MERITQGMNIKDVLRILRQADGYFITNTARDLSQSDFKNRILLHTDLLAAEAREKVKKRPRNPTFPTEPPGWQL